MVLDLIKDRCSVRQFLNKKVPDEAINGIMEAARLAPSYMNVQPWHFIVVKNKATIQLLSKFAHGQPHVVNAPVIIVCCGDMSCWDKDKFKVALESRPGITQERINILMNNPSYNPKLKGHDAVIYRTLEELTYAVAYMTLEAHSQGLGSCTVGGIGNELTGSIPEVYKRVKKELNLPENFMIGLLLPIGYPDPNEACFDKRRKPKSEVVSYEKYGQ